MKYVLVASALAALFSSQLNAQEYLDEYFSGKFPWIQKVELNGFNNYNEEFFIIESKNELLSYIDSAKQSSLPEINFDSSFIVRIVIDKNSWKKDNSYNTPVIQNISFARNLPAANSVNYSFIDGPTVFLLNEKDSMIVRDEAEWKRLWKDSKEKDIPKIDFNEFVVIGKSENVDCNAQFKQYIFADNQKNLHWITFSEYGGCRGMLHHNFWIKVPKNSINKIIRKG